MSAELLEVVGTSLYGQQWQSDLARDLGLSARAVRHWSQTGAIPAAKWRRIQDLCRQRIERLDMAVQAIEVVS